MSLRSDVRSRLRTSLLAAGPLAVVALLAVTTAPSAVAADPEPTPVEPAPVVTAGPACTGGGVGDGPWAGARTPLDGSRWVASYAAPGRLVLGRSQAEGVVDRPLATVVLPGAPGTAGGMTFGADGSLYVVAAAGSGGEAVLYRTTGPLRPSARALTAVEVSRSATSGTVTRIAFARDGLLHLVEAGGSTAVDPVTGDAVATYDAAAGQRLACGRPSRLRVRVASDDVLLATLDGAAYDGTPASPRGDVLDVLALPGATYGVRLTTPDGAEAEGYDVALSCVGGATTATDTDGEVATGSVTMPARAASVGCTVTALAAAEPERGPDRRPTAPSVAALGREDSGLGGGIGTDREKDEPTKPKGDDGEQGRGAEGQDLGRDLGDQMRRDGALGGGTGGGLGDLGGGMPGATDTDTEAGADQTDAARDGGPNLPNTGGPPAVVLPVALGAIALGGVLVARRRRPAPRHRGA